MAYEALYTRGRPKTLSQLIGQEHISNALARAISIGRLSHAYLLVGTRGTGKTSTARLLSKAMNCEKVHEAQASGQPLDKKEIPCNKCDSCRNFDSSPDNVEFDAASNRSVEDVTRLLSTAYLAPLRARVKTFIIDEVHMLSFEAVNSILKLIEEPPPNVAFFLATTEVNKVPMTIRSRCQVLNFRLIPQQTIAPYLMTLARRLNVKLHEDAAKKLARLAAGSMRDALTFLDQCYAMADDEITLTNVNETLGLIEDGLLNKIIVTIRARNRAVLAQVITELFQSGLAPNAIAEALITRLRDAEFELIENKTERTLYEFDRMIDVLRQTLNEMSGSGIPDILLEMALMRLGGDPIIRPDDLPKQMQNTSSSENLDAGKKIFYDVAKVLREGDAGLANIIDKAVVTNFVNDTVTLTFKSDAQAGIFKRNYQRKVEQELTKVTGRTVKISCAVDPNLPPPILKDMPEPERTNLANAMDVFHAADATKIND